MIPAIDLDSNCQMSILPQVPQVPHQSSTISRTSTVCFSNLSSTHGGSFPNPQMATSSEKDDQPRRFGPFFVQHFAEKNQLQNQLSPAKTRSTTSRWRCVADATPPGEATDGSVLIWMCQRITSRKRPFLSKVRGICTFWDLALWRSQPKSRNPQQNHENQQLNLTRNSKWGNSIRSFILFDLLRSYPSTSCHNMFL